MNDADLHDPHYLTYILRLWMVQAPNGVDWRALLESPLTGERIGFPDLEALFSFLETITQNSMARKVYPPE